MNILAKFGDKPVYESFKEKLNISFSLLSVSPLIMILVFSVFFPFFGQFYAVAKVADDHL
jgi:hypothetical protein